MMNTGSPMRTRSESPTVATSALVGTLSSWSNDTSASSSEATTRAPTRSPPRKSTTILSARCTTWAAVITFPSAAINTPEPTPLNLASWPSEDTSRSLVRTITTDGFTALKIWERSWAHAGAVAMATAVRVISVRIAWAKPVDGQDVGAVRPFSCFVMEVR
jgi:hypothetical protein